MLLRHDSILVSKVRSLRDFQGDSEPAGIHGAQRGGSDEAATLIYRILANEEPVVTAHDYAAQASNEALPGRGRDLLNMRAVTTERRRKSYQTWKAALQQQRSATEAEERHRGRSHHRSTDYGFEL